MKDILLKRNELKRNSIALSNVKFDDETKDKDIENLLKEEDKVYNKWKFYDKFIKIREKEKKK